MKIIQLTDLHLVPEGQKIHEIDPSQRFEQALANIKLRHPDLDLLVITGDLCNEGDTPSYRLLRALLEKYKLNYQLVLGNHDQREPFKGVFPETAIDPMVSFNPKCNPMGKSISFWTLYRKVK